MCKGKKKTPSFKIVAILLTFPLIDSIQVCLNGKKKQPVIICALLSLKNSIANFIVLSLAAKELLMKKKNHYYSRYSFDCSKQHYVVAMNYL